MNMAEIKQKIKGPRVIDSHEFLGLEPEVVVRPLKALPPISGALTRQERSAARIELTRRFTEELLVDFAANGASAIADCRLQKPDVYCKIIAGLLPKEIEIRPEATMSDNELNAALLRYLASDIAKVIEGTEGRFAEAPSGAGAAQETQSAGGLHRLSQANGVSH